MCFTWTVFCHSLLTVWKCELEFMVHWEHSPITPESGLWEMRWQKEEDNVCWDAETGQKKSTQEPGMLGNLRITWLCIVHTPYPPVPQTV